MNKKILIIDDDKDVVNMVKRNLETEGYGVSAAYDGNEGLLSVETNPPELIILDVNLPTVSGHEVCQNLRTKKTSRYIPIIIVSANNKPIDKIEFLKLGANDYLTKPFDMGELLARVSSHLKQTEEIMAVNPLTKLPGNISITNEINNRIDKSAKFAFAYLDINNFKSYNDQYGFNKGDDVIRFMADVIKRCTKDSDFVGHIGGDDFVVMLEIADIEAFCRKVTGLFNTEIVEHYNPRDRINGYIIARDRKEHIQKFPIMSVSIGVATNERREYNHFAKIIEIATEMKNFAKKKCAETNICYAIDKRKD